MEQFETTKRRFHNDESVVITRGRSNIEYSKFENGFFDFIYIDALHTYKSTKEDITNWYPKLKKGGIIAGHDYCLKDIGKPTEYGVIKAVTEFRKENETIIKDFRTFGNGKDICWLIETK